MGMHYWEEAPLIRPLKQQTMKQAVESGGILPSLD